LLLGGGLGSGLSGGLGFSLGRCLLSGGFLGRGLGNCSGLGRGGGLGSLSGGLGGGSGLGGGGSLLSGRLGGGRGLGNLCCGLHGLSLVGLLGRLTAGGLTTLGDDRLTLLPGLDGPLLEEVSILRSFPAGLVDLSRTLGVFALLVVDALGCDQALDLDGLVTLDDLAILLLGLDLLLVGIGILAHVILLAQVEELPDLAGSLGTQAAGDVFISESRQLGVSLLYDDQRKGRHVGADNATTNRLPLALAIASGSETRVASFKQEANTSLNEDTLHHGETLLVISTCDSEDVAFEFITQSVSSHLLGHALVIENAPITE
jgi:hypothetical protein